MHNHLQRIMNLVRRTGDRVIVTDGENAEDSFVLMSLDDYELLMEDRFDAVDQEEGEWSDDDWQPDTIDVADEIAADALAHDDSEPAEAIEDEDSWRGEIPPEAYEEGDEDGVAQTLDNEPGYGTIRTANENSPKKRKNWQIPPEIKRGSEAVEEDRYYLENV